MPKRFKKIQWDHTAICHQGMNEHANVSTIEKAKDGKKKRSWVKKNLVGEPVFKYDLIKVASSEAAGHRHGIRVEIRDGELMLWCMYATKPGDDSGHDHMIMVNADGNFDLITNNGHKHTVSGDDIAAEINSQLFKSFEFNGKSLSTLYSDYLGKMKDANKGDDPMSDDNKETMEVSKAEWESTQAAVAKLTKIQALTKDQSAYYATLDGEEAQDAFLAKAKEDRDAEVKKFKDAEVKKGTDEEVLYKSADGQTVVRKGDPGAEATAAALRTADEAVAKLEDKELTETVEKEFSHMPGESDVKKRLVSIVKKHGGEQTDAILKILKSKDESFAKSVKPQSTSVQKDLESESDDLNEVAKDLNERVAKMVAENPHMSRAEALVAVKNNEDQA